MKATLSISAAEARVAEKLRVTLEVTAEPEVEITLPFIGSEWESWRVSNVQIDRGSNTTASSVKTQKLTFEIMALKTGEQQVPSLTVQFFDRRHQPTADTGTPAPKEAVAEANTSNELILESLKVNITSVLEADADPTRYRDAKGLAEINVPKPWTFWALAVVLGIASLLIAGASLLYIRRNWQRQIKMARVLPPHEWAVQQIEKLVSEKLIEQGQLEPFYVRLSGIVRTYLEIRFGLMAPERTTEEFLSDAQRSTALSLEHQALLGQFLLASDMVKFARYRPESEEINRSIQAARVFIRDTQPTTPATPRAEAAA